MTLVKRQQVTSAGFVVKENGAVIMEDDTRKEVLTVWQKRKQEEITHPYLEEKIPLGLVSYVQSLLLARLYGAIWRIIRHSFGSEFFCCWFS